jgi:glycine cleavage system aminomethyltransferase T
VGEVTSAVEPPGWPHPVALAYVKSKVATDTVVIRLREGTVQALVVELPFADRASS